MAEPAHTTSTEHVPKGEHEGGFPPFNSETFASQLVWLAFSFVLLYALMAKWALPRVKSIIEGRQNHIDGDIAEANRLKSQSDAAAAAYEQALADARAKAQAIANETREKQTAESNIQRKKLEDELNGKLAEAEKSIALTKQAAMNNVRGIAEEATRAIVERLIGAAPSEKEAAQAVSEVLKG
jgi:F-type H+-transporting ATPase subunit b